MPAPRSEPPVCSRQRQRGGILIFTALGMGVLLACLLVLDIANLVWQKREIQKIADLAAVAGASAPFQNHCIDANGSRLNQTARRNGFGNQANDSLQAQFGEWKPEKYAEQPAFFQALQDPLSSNACAVEITRYVRSLFPWITRDSTRTISVTAVAYSPPPLASVAIRSGVLHINDGFLSTLLNTALGGNVNVSAITWQGLAGVNINLLQFADELIESGIGVNVEAGNYEKLLSTEVSLADIVEAMVVVLQEQQSAQLAVNVLQALLRLNLNKIMVRLGDILVIETGSGSNALDLNLDALDLVSGSLQVANKDNALNFGLSLPNGSIQARLKIIEPPQFSVSGTPKPFDPEANISIRTAQIRLWLAVTPSASLITDAVTKTLDGVISLVKILLGIVTLGTINIDPVKLNDLALDILIELGGGHVKVDEVECEENTPSMRISTHQALGSVHLGTLPGLTIEQRESQAFGPALPNMQPINILQIGNRCIGDSGWCIEDEDKFGAIRVGGVFDLLGSKQEINVDANFINPFGQLPERTKYLKITPKLTEGLSNILDVTDLIQLYSFSDLNLIDKVKDLLNFFVQPVLVSVGLLLDELLPFLGISLGEVEVAPYLQCGSKAQLVY
ncbi:MAG: TadG family pilus assembly protein [Comamonas sp.]